MGFAEEKQNSQKMILKTIVLLDKDIEVSPSLKGVQIKLFSKEINQLKLKRKLQPFIGQVLTEEGIAKIKKVVLEFYILQNHPFVVVAAPEQKITNGTLKLLITESQLGKIQIKGNHHFKQELLKKYISIQNGQEIQVAKLERDVSLINRNPFRNASLILLPGEKENTTDIELWVADRYPYRLYAGVDDTGIKTTGTNRFFIGTNFSNLWGLDHVFSYQFTSSFEPQKFFSHTVTYTLPVFYRHFLTVYGGYSSIKPKSSIHNLKHKGKGAQASLRYAMPLSPKNQNTHELSFGYDYKLTNVNMTYFGIPLIRNSVNISQFMGKYEKQINYSKIKIPFSIEVYCSPGRMLPDQSESDFSWLRYKATNHYVYSIFSLSPLFTLYRDAELFINLRVQLASQNLISTEQYPLGGFYSVRGYDENEVYRDNAVLNNIELRFPTFTVLKKIKNRMQFLVFLDAAAGWDTHPTPNLKNEQYLIGIGPGVRFNIENYLACRLDWGIKLHRTGLESHSSSQKIHFSVVGSF